jgi:NitT/TauT family transport system permease protein
MDEPVATPTVRQTGRRRRRRHGEMRGYVVAIVLPFLVLPILLGAWEAVSRTDTVDPIILPPPSEIASASWRLMQEEYFWEAVKITLYETLAGFAIGSAAGLVLGAAIGTVPIVRHVLYPFVIAFQNTPRVALAPLFLTWFGFGLTSKIVMAATICFFPPLINTVVGIDTVDDDARTLLRSFGASRWQTFRKLTLQSSLPMVFAGLKTAMTLALIGAIVAEFVGATKGMGVLINTFNFQLNVAEAFSVIIALSLIGVVLYGVMELLDRRIVFWRDR